MSLSGNDVLALIDRTLTDTRSEIGNVDARLMRTTAELERLKQAEIGCLSVLAKMRLREIEGASVSASLDATGESVRSLLAQREGAQAEVEAEIDRAEARREELARERGAQHDVVDAAEKGLDEARAAAQKALSADEKYAQAMAAAEASDRVADLADEKGKAAHADREQKGKPYEADRLFSYLWTRGFGTPAYVGVGFSRVLDRWVARVANFEPLRRDYWMLTELPARFDEHAQRMRRKSDDDLAAVHALERAAAEVAEVPQREDELAKAAESLAAVDERVDQHETAIDALIEKRAAFAAGDDELSRRANEIVRDALRGETMRSLRERANSTPTPDDDAAVDQLTEIRANLPKAETDAKRFRDLHDANRDRAAKLEEVRKRFKDSRYDAVSSEFVNGALIATLLTQLLAGALGVGDLWDALKKQQRYKQLADPRFGSGKFPRGPNPWGGGWGGGRGGWGGGGRGGGFGGGGFRTGGGFGGGGFKTGGKF
jgi:chromosome segregation ATPase